MVLYYSNKLKSGLKIIYNKEPHNVLLTEFIKPGKGQAFFRMKFKNLVNRKLVDKTCKSVECFQSADVLELVVSYMFHDQKNWFFMNKKNFEQIAVGQSIITRISSFLLEEHDYIVTLWNSNPIYIDFANNFINLTVLKTTPCVNCNTIGNSNKLALLSSGVTIKVPTFIEVGQIIKVDTRTGEYTSKIS